MSLHVKLGQIDSGLRRNGKWRKQEKNKQATHDHKVAC
jgi:hypothetical protein